MAKTLLYTLFRIGRIPRRFRPALDAEGIRIADEGIGGSLTYRNFRAPGKVFLLRRVWFTGSIAVTGTRLAAFAYGRRLIHIPLDHPRMAEIDIHLEKPDLLRIALDAGTLSAAASGRIEFRFRTPAADTIARHLTAAAKR